MSGSVSPLPWTGNKGCIYTTIDAFMPPHRTYVEACMGSAEVFLRKKPVEKEIINDYNGDLVRLFRVLQRNENLERLIGRLFLSFNSEQIFRANKALLAEVPNIAAAMSDISCRSLPLSTRRRCLAKQEAADECNGSRRPEENCRCHSDRQKSIENRWRHHPWYATIPLLKCGYTAQNVADANPSDMERYYSKTEQAQWGVVAIELELIKDWRDNAIIKTSRYISLILRHKPEATGIRLDKNGWANAGKLIRGVSKTHPLDMALLEEIVATDDKQRYTM